MLPGQLLKSLSNRIRIRNYFHKSWLSGQDPWVTSYKDSYLLIQSAKDDTIITIRKFDKLSNLSKSEEITVWQPGSDSDHSRLLWAPELHKFPRFSDKWYIYYAACDGANENHRMYVLESVGENPLGPYRDLGKVYDKDNDFWAIDLTVFLYNRKLFGVWSGWEGHVKLDRSKPWEKDAKIIPQQLYIASMSNPWTISGERVLISRPDLEWEKSVAPINEGPQILKRDNRIFVIYSADASWTPQYKLGLLTFDGSDILNPYSWTKYSKPVFEQGGTTAYGPGHASFVSDKEKDVIVYHVKKNTTYDWEREIRYKSFTWDDNKLPRFGTPV